jgi:hypothetical protein
MAFDHIAIGIDLLADYLVQRSRSPAMTVTAQVQLAAKRGDVLAKRAIASGLWNDPKPAKPTRTARPAPPPPAMTKNQLAAAQHSAAIVRRLERESEQTGVPWQYVGSHRDSLYVEKRAAGRREAVRCAGSSLQHACALIDIRGHLA